MATTTKYRKLTKAEAERFRSTIDRAGGHVGHSRIRLDDNVLVVASKPLDPPPPAPAPDPWHGRTWGRERVEKLISYVGQGEEALAALGINQADALAGRVPDAQLDAAEALAAEMVSAIEAERHQGALARRAPPPEPEADAAERAARVEALTEQYRARGYSASAAKAMAEREVPR